MKMYLGNRERWYVNGWFRGMVQRPLELAWLQRLYPWPRGVALLDLGCGDGRGLAALIRKLQPLTAVGVDPDPRQLAAARRTLAKNSQQVQLLEASAAALPLPAQSYDVVTSFGCIHHVPYWQAAVAEVARVLRHGGLFYAVEFYQPLLGNALFARLFPHPPERFTHAALLAELTSAGLVVLRQVNLWGLAGLVVARRVADGAYD
jgi:ubiquinone/menaquinone biosynthesis C-methylase UbiE